MFCVAFLFNDSGVARPRRVAELSSFRPGLCSTSARSGRRTQCAEL